MITCRQDNGRIPPELFHRTTQEEARSVRRWLEHGVGEAATMVRVALGGIKTFAQQARIGAAVIMDGGGATTRGSGAKVGGPLWLKRGPKPIEGTAVVAAGRSRAAAASDDVGEGGAPRG
jgi:hypothetical protein